jgi:hypothetical protein
VRQAKSFGHELLCGLEWAWGVHNFLRLDPPDFLILGPPDLLGLDCTHPRRQLPESGLPSRSCQEHEREGAMSRRVLTVDRYKEIERRSRSRMTAIAELTPVDEWLVLVACRRAPTPRCQSKQ